MATWWGLAPTVAIGLLLWAPPLRTGDGAASAIAWLTVPYLTGAVLAAVGTRLAGLDPDRKVPLDAVKLAGLMRKMWVTVGVMVAVVAACGLLVSTLVLSWGRQYDRDICGPPPWFGSGCGEGGELAFFVILLSVGAFLVIGSVSALTAVTVGAALEDRHGVECSGSGDDGAEPPMT